MGGFTETLKDSVTPAADTQADNDSLSAIAIMELVIKHRAASAANDTEAMNEIEDRLNQEGLIKVDAPDGDKTWKHFSELLGDNDGENTEDVPSQEVPQEDDDDASGAYDEPITPIEVA